MMELYTINQVSKLYGISTRMLYYYEKIGLISSLRKSEYAYRVYDETALLRLQQILILRKLRIPMKQIHIILNNAQTTEAIELFVHNIQELEEEIKTLAIIRDALSHLVKELKQSSSIHMNFDSYIPSVLSIAETLSLSKNLIKETIAMEDVKSTEAKRISFGGYQWIILEEKDNKILILTEEIIGQRDYHSDLVDITWEDSEMRQYLNSTFYETFSPKEQARILETQVSDRDNPWSGTKCGNPTIDKVFLLSYDEVIRYFGDSGDMRNRISWFWEDTKGFPGGIPVRNTTALTDGLFINDQYCPARRAFKPDGTLGWWWLRSPGGAGQHTSGSVGLIGEIFLCGDDVYNHPYRDINGDGGIRPAMWIRI